MNVDTSFRTAFAGRSVAANATASATSRARSGSPFPGIGRICKLVFALSGLGSALASSSLDSELGSPASQAKLLPPDFDDASLLSEYVRALLDTGDDMPASGPGSGVEPPIRHVVLIVSEGDGAGCPVATELVSRAGRAADGKSRPLDLLQWIPGVFPDETRRDMSEDRAGDKERYMASRLCSAGTDQMTSLAGAMHAKHVNSRLVFQNYPNPHLAASLRSPNRTLAIVQPLFAFWEFGAVVDGILSSTCRVTKVPWHNSGPPDLLKDRAENGDVVSRFWDTGAVVTIVPHDTKLGFSFEELATSMRNGRVHAVFPVQNGVPLSQANVSVWVDQTAASVEVTKVFERGYGDRVEFSWTDHAVAAQKKRVLVIADEDNVGARARAHREIVAQGVRPDDMQVVTRDALAAEGISPFESRVLNGAALVGLAALVRSAARAFDEKCLKPGRVAAARRSLLKARKDTSDKAGWRAVCANARGKRDPALARSLMDMLQEQRRDEAEIRAQQIAEKEAGRGQRHAKAVLERRAQGYTTRVEARSKGDRRAQGQRSSRAQEATHAESVEGEQLAVPREEAGAIEPVWDPETKYNNTFQMITQLLHAGGEVINVDGSHFHLRHRKSRKNFLIAISGYRHNEKLQTKAVNAELDAWWRWNIENGYVPPPAVRS